MVKHVNSNHPSVAHPPHYLHELPQEDEERLESLFKSLDVDGNGRIDIHDLSVALREFGVNQSYAKKFIERSDQNKSGDICLGEFIHYVKEHEKNLRLQFSDLDKNKDGMIDAEELIKAFKELGVEIDRKEAVNLLQRMDQDGSLAISFDEWRDYLLYAPSTDIIEIIKYWRHSTYLDIGEDLNVPDDFTPSEIASGQWWRHLLAGGIAGGVSRTCTAPLDRLKVYLQVHGTKQLGVKDCLKHMLQEGGIWSLWRGNGMNVVKIAPESAIKFMAYEQAKKLIRGNNTRELSIYERFVAGSLAGGISQTVIYPLEVMKTRLALRKTGEFSSIVDAAKKMYRKGGWKTFYRGYVPNLLGIIPYAGIDLAVYETIKNSYIRQHNEGETPSVMLLLACGTVSSTCGQVCSYPLALVRTRLQAQVVTNVGGQSQEMCSMMGVIRNIIQRDGPLGLYRGITPNFLKVAPAVSISYVVYERCRQTLGVNMT
ncbi:mitochondrial adenyl nucleotide antiporter SLC25A24-B [Periplaneta americana]|uniref:mitochondrial adenyl nucleotide antiporter SLC25A24-B n=1 Tax=Periplaneta americana TaxID=6978 RepID=UPI0037E89ED0